ncbi:glycosyltransferase family 4 protein [Flagellimonas sediminis]|uniref:Glycosyltransferase n=1 Tax=Flagellimonas sediminis TaxID=2696468 RepID=A0A6I5KRR4_9FLAO|nr:glycosyltransferase family 4 protein [Allomuricauda sediminis]NDV42635.1 glycosyltransferase [Allomuricauda sediminis]
MKILYIHQYFRTPYEPGGTRSYWISQELIKNGHEVVMLTTNSDANQKKWVERKTIDGINVIYVKVAYENEMGILKRLVAFLSFMLYSSYLGLKVPKVDLMIATSTPLTVGFPAMVIKKLKGTPYLFEVRDLWPEVPIQMGAIKNKFLQKLTRSFEKSIYKNAKHIVALSPGMKDGVMAQGVKDEKVTMIPNMAKMDKFWPREINTSYLKKLNLREDSFKVVYFGALGLANGIEYIMDAIVELKDDPSIDFVFIGQGKMAARIEERKNEEQLTNLHYYGSFKMEDTSEIVNLCHVSLVTFDDLPILATNSPNKLFDSLSAGKPIIVNNPGWTKDLVEKNNCGVYADCKSPSDLAAKIRFLRDNQDLRKQMGINSRKLAETKYDKSILCDQFAKTVKRLEPGS